MSITNHPHASSDRCVALDNSCDFLNGRQNYTDHSLSSPNTPFRICGVIKMVGDTQVSCQMAWFARPAAGTVRQIRPCEFGETAVTQRRRNIC